MEVCGSVSPGAWRKAVHRELSGALEALCYKTARCGGYPVQGRGDAGCWGRCECARSLALEDPHTLRNLQSAHTRARKQINPFSFCGVSLEPSTGKLQGQLCKKKSLKAQIHFHSEIQKGE